MRDRTVKHWRSAVASFLAASSLTAAIIAVAGDSSPCGTAMFLEVRRGAPVCVHSSETPPLGVDIKRRPSVSELRVRDATPVAPDTNTDNVRAEAPVGVACIGGGTEGDRVQAVYAR